MKKLRAHVVIQGLVQGVFFRATTMERARVEGLTGWVRNTRGGSVEAVFEGEEGPVKDIVRWCGKGPLAAKVEQVDVSYEEFQGEFTDFTMLRD